VWNKEDPTADEFQDFVDLVDGDKPAEGDDSTDDQGSHEWM